MDSKSYWLGVAETLAFLQADHDSEANYEAALKSGTPHNAAIQVRLPYDDVPEPEDLDRFGLAVAYLNIEATILYWRHVKTEYGEHYVEVASTEGYLGFLPPESEPDWRYC